MPSSADLPTPIGAKSSGRGFYAIPWPILQVMSSQGLRYDQAVRQVRQREALVRQAPKLRGR